MSSFLFEKEQINCACFESSSQSVRRIFRSESDHSSGNGPKNNKEISAKNKIFQSNNKKKSLRKQKPLERPVSQICQEKYEPNTQQIYIPEILPKNTKKQVKFTTIEPPLSQKFNGMLTQRSRPSQNSRTCVYPMEAVSQTFIIEVPKRTHHYRHSTQLITPVQNEQYDKLVQQEFKKDLEEFKRQMDNLHLEKRAGGCEGQKNPAIQHPISLQNIVQPQDFKQKDTIQKSGQLSQRQIHNIESLFLTTNNKNPSKANPPPQQKIPSLNKIISLPQPQKPKSHYKTLHELRQPPSRRERKESFRNSTICYKEKQNQTKRLKDKMHAKEIESEKDGSSSSESDKMSEVVGRGWDGMTEQKIQLEELDQMIKKENGHSETMVTQQSHIKNSEIKTFTDYSNSFISPKSHNSKPMGTSMAFGGPKYGIAGMSYQNLDGLRKVKNSFQGQSIL